MPYTDSQGVVRDDMTYGAALNTVYELAEQNQIDENDIGFGDEGLEEQQEWQETALDTVRAAIDRTSVELDRLETPEAFRDFPEEFIRADRSFDPADTLSAIKIVLDMARTNALAADDVEMDVEAARQQQAIDLVTDLIGRHGDMIPRQLAPSPR